MSSDIYRIEKNRWPVTVTLTGGERLSGDMFVQSRREWDVGGESPCDVLNGGEEFFPLAVTAGETWLIAKAMVVAVETSRPIPADPERVAAACREAVELQLGDGTTLSGSVDIEARGEHPRMLDFLNRCPERFLTLSVEDRSVFVNRALIERVRAAA